MYYNPYPTQQPYQYPYDPQYPNTFRTDFTTLIGDFFTVPNTIPDVVGGISISGGTFVFIHDVSSSGVTIVAPSKKDATCIAISITISPETLDGVASFR
ncbi:hypothetical protein F8172_16980 [Bacillus cereus]|uniref:Uncharacterized protein n=1 Tax=Bacillus cereus TaxID=1396 RepID=A0A9W7QEP2_BACCE|nr:hypothetical protein F8172_16980 [Bacillus cereus]KAB2407416.1 hypothetical protein F8170_11015 [Bacillus cereus]KAB2428586.1 hypothetical protein F8168_17440 [Bacillus cereus]